MKNNLTVAINSSATNFECSKTVFTKRAAVIDLLTLLEMLPKINYYYFL